MKTKTLLTSLAVITIINLLTTCKKYPENTLWFKTPNSAISSGYLKAFTVNGTDSLPMWNTIYNTSPYNGYSPPPPNTQYDISTVLWNFNTTPGEIQSDFGYGSFHLFDNKKQIYIFFRMTEDLNNYPPPKYNFFYTVESTWKILKLTKSGTLRIQRTYNNKVYEMEFA